MPNPMIDTQGTDNNDDDFKTKSVDSKEEEEVTDMTWT